MKWVPAHHPDANRDNPAAEGDELSKKCYYQIVERRVVRPGRPGILTKYRHDLKNSNGNIDQQMLEGYVD